MKKYYLIVFSVLFLSCSLFKDKQENFQKINENNITILNGYYTVFAKNKTNKYYYFDNLNEKFYRKYGRGERDTINFDTITGGSLKISILSERELNLDFIKNEKTLKSQRLKYKFKKDGFLYIKNSNTLISGIQFIFGGVDVRKVRIALNEDNDLLLNNVFNSSGAFLLIFGDAKVSEETNIYKRIK